MKEEADVKENGEEVAMRDSRTRVISMRDALTYLSSSDTREGPDIQHDQYRCQIDLSGREQFLQAYVWQWSAFSLFPQEIFLFVTNNS